MSASWLAIALTARAGEIIRRDGKCYGYSGFPGEEVRCTKMPGHAAHDGGCLYPIPAQEEDVETIVKLILETMKANAVQQETLIKEIEKALKANALPSAEPEQGPKKTRTKKAEEVKVPASAEKSMRDAENEMAEKIGKTIDKVNEGPLLVQDVTIEKLREMATKYSAAFGMEKLLELNVKHGGAKKLSGIDPKMYGVLYGAMGDQLAKATEAAIKEVPPKTNGAKPDGTISIETVRKQAADFMTANGQPALQALLKAFGAAKLSELAKEKYPAFIEAISNA